MNVDSPVKIAFLTPEYPHQRTPGPCGGIGTSVLNLANEMTKGGQAVSIIVYGQEEDEAFEENGVAFYRVKNSDRKRMKWFFTQKKIEKLINTLVEHQKVNIVEAADWQGKTAFIRPRCPVIVKLHGSDTYFASFENKKVHWLTRYLEKRALSKADALVSVSQFTADVTKKVFKLQRDFTIIHNGVDITKFESTPAPAAPEKIILYFGTLVRKKGSLELPFIFNRVVEKVPDAKLVLVGGNSNDPSTGNPSVWKMMREMFSTQAALNAKYCGSVHYSEIKNFINEASLCVFPSFAEALPVSWIEAMIMGKAIVASDIGWAKELIDDGKDGYLVNPTNHSLFADRIIEILVNAELQSALGTAAQRKAKIHFSTEEIAAQNMAHYAKVIYKSRHSDGKII